MTVRARLEAHLHAHDLTYRVMEHDHAKTSEEVAIARGTPLFWGGKALVFKLGKQTDFAVFAINGNRQVISKAIRHHLGLRRLRFATQEELMTLTGLKPGCVPPFGQPIFDIPLYVDATLAGQQDIAFSIGSHTASATLKIKDYLVAAKPVSIFAFSEEKT